MWHYAYVRYLVRERRLPPWDIESPVGQESSQPPLYYVTAALATAWIDGSSAEVYPDRNPHWGYPSAGTVPDNKNIFLHERTGAEAFPWGGTALAVHVARLVNLAFGALTVAFTYLLAREVFPERAGLVASAAAVVAFNPQFLFISSAINNDAAASTFSTIAIWLLVGGLRRGYTYRRSAILGGGVGLAALSKVSALALVPFVILAIGFRMKLLSGWVIGGQTDKARTSRAGPRQGDRFRRFAVHCTLFVALVLAVSGWWYGRNAVMYGDPFGLGTHLETWWAHEEPLSAAQIWAQLPSIERSFWAAFGWGNVHLPWVFYIFTRVATRLALVGLLVWGVRAAQAGDRPGPRAWSLGLLALWVVVVFAALLRWMQLVEAALGRLLFPAIGPIAVLMTWGLSQLTSTVMRVVPGATHVAKSLSRSVPAILAGALLCAAAASPFVAIRPAYAQPPLLSDEEVASCSDAINVRFGDGIQLVGFGLRPQSVSRGAEASATLCWKALAPTMENYAYFVHFLGPNESIVGARDTHPGLGRFPTSQWTPGDSFCDVVRVPVAEEAAAPAVYDVEIGWYEPETGDRLPVQGADGSPIELVTVGKIEILPEREITGEPPNRIGADLGERVTLLGYGLDGGGSQVASGETIDVTLYWQARSLLTANYTVFLHLASAASSPHAQDDGQPRDGTYPTSYWDVGQVVVDGHTLLVPDDLPPGQYPLVVGMYLLETGERLPAYDMAGERLPADAVPLTEIEVLP
jgi:4-amino-4-deoxy-L-arabinose transferase-like glycosyltransferase